MKKRMLTLGITVTMLLGAFATGTVVGALSSSNAIFGGILVTSGNITDNAKMAYINGEPISNDPNNPAGHLDDTDFGPTE